MKATPTTLKIRELVNLKKNGMLTANPEYQRGTVWSSVQKKKLIDSVFRGYPLPLIYLHHIQKDVAGMRREDLEIIDGQQRLNSLYEYSEGNFKLFDPKTEGDKAKFPRFLVEKACPWGGLDFNSLSDDLKNQFLDTELSISKIESETSHEVRDLFVRLQSGLPLNAQETRDAWPGQFTEFVLSLGGKPEIPRYPGHAFFRGPMGLTGSGDRGKARQFAAQIAMIFLMRRERSPEFIPDINAASVNEFYFSHIDFDRFSSDALRLVEVLDKLSSLLGAGSRPKLKAHDAIHLVLLVDSLWDDYTRSWEANIAAALDRFLEALATAKNQKDSDSPSEYWTRYGQWTRVNSDRGERILHRHQFYVERMLQFMGPLTSKDPVRLYGELERQILYFRKQKRCDVCGGPIQWSEVEIHHVEAHKNGGQTSIENAALVHKSCHPKSAAATEALAKKLKYSVSELSTEAADQTSSGAYLWASKEGFLNLPDGTRLRMTYKGRNYFAAVTKSRLQYDGETISPSALAKKITNSSRNAWRDFFVNRPNESEWNLASDIREPYEDQDS